MENQIINDILQEYENQILKWGLQNHPSVDNILMSRKGGCSPDRMCEEYEIPTETRARLMCELASQRNQVTWSHIAVEELAEVISCRNDTERREELVQLAAVIYSWIDKIDRNSPTGIRDTKISSIVE
jgi:hypothetical protein